MMHRTQVYFEPEILEILKAEARYKKTTLASVIREKVEKNIEKKPRKRKSVFFTGKLRSQTQKRL